MNLAACIEDKYMFGEHPDIPSRIRAARAAGLGAVDFHMWLERDAAAIERALLDTGVRLNSIVVNPRCGAVDASRLDYFMDCMRGTIAMAVRLKAPAVVVAGGPALKGASDAAQHAAIVTSLTRIAPVAEDAGTTVILEPLNTRVDHVGFYMATAREGLDIVEEVGSPAVRLLYDIYHSAVMDEAPRDVLAGRGHLVGYVQVADKPGRHEPGSGTIDWPLHMAALREAGYRGDIGLEYRPSGDTLDSLARARRALGVGS